ncbi:hypothetical protein D9M72_385500 [compost metagenome]
MLSEQQVPCAGGECLLEQSFKILGLPFESLDLLVLGRNESLQSGYLLLGLVAALSENDPLVVQVVALCREHVPLRGHRVLGSGRTVCEQRRIKVDLGLVVTLRPEPRGQRLARCDPVLNQVQLCFGLRVVEPDQNLASLDDVTVGGVQLRDDATLKVLDELAVAGHLDNARCHCGAVQRRQCRPTSGHAEEQEHDGESGPRHARDTQGYRLRHRGRWRG